MSYLDQCICFSYNCKDVLTEPILIKQGVHQDNVLSPLLFNIFINYIGNELCVDDAPILHL